MVEKVHAIEIPVQGMDCAGCTRTVQPAIAKSAAWSVWCCSWRTLDMLPATAHSGQRRDGRRVPRA